MVELPKPLEAVLEKLFQKKPEKRYASALELKQALAAIVAPAPINPPLFETPKTPIPATRLAEPQDRKPATGPTILAKINETTQATQSKRLFTNAISMEALILAGAVVVAAVIIGVWFFIIEPSPKKDEITQKDSTKTEQPTVVFKQDSVANTPSVALATEDKKEADFAKPVENQPVKERQPVQKQPINPKPDKPKPQEPAPPKQQEPEKPTDEKPKEEKREEPKPVRKVTVELGSEPLAIQFMETVTSDDPVGKTVLLQAVSSVVVEGHTVIPSGAKVRGRITDSRSASDSKKAFLAVRFEAVQAANGEWISLKYPEYSDKASGQVVFQAGRRVSQVRTTRTTLTVQL
jgi:serine/threonine-protein kinase